MTENTSWSDGYVTNIEYTGGFYRDLTPGLLRMALLLHGMDLPKRPRGEPLRYLELGYGQGVSLNIHAAAFAETTGAAAKSAPLSGEFWGTDIAPNHTLRAGELARTSGADLRLLDASFAELDARSARGELPQFDIIALHGVWSWISDENRGHILNILHRNGKTGGLVYLSYNALPGWAGLAPLRDMLALHASLVGSEAQPLPQRVGQAYAFARRVADTGARYFAEDRRAAALLEQLSSMPLSYVAHEYCNRDWRPFYFADVARTLSMAKLSFAASSRFLDHMASVCLPPQGRELLERTEHPLLRETLRDYGINRRFRADIFVKGDHRLSPKERLRRIGALRLSLTAPLEAVSLTVPGPLGELSLKEEIYKPVLAALADNNYAPKTVEELEDHPLLETLDSAPLLEALTVLTGAGYAHPAQDAAAAESAAPACARLNAALLERAAQGETSPALASPVLGGGVFLPRLEQLFLLSHWRGGDGPKDWAEDAADALSARGEQVLRDGTPLERDEIRKELTALAEIFDSRLPFLETLGLTPPAPDKE